MSPDKGRSAIPSVRGLVGEPAGAENGVVVFASTTGREDAQEKLVWGNGAFTKALLEGLGGAADINRDSAIHLYELNYWVAEGVKRLTGGEQHANMVIPLSIPDYPLAVRR